MKGTKAASRYAKALLELAIEQQKLDQVAADMAYLTQVNAESAELAVLLNSPIINSHKKISIFKELFGAYDTLSISFVELITKNGREALLAEIASSFTAQLKTYRGITPVTLVSATKLNDTTRKAILSKVEGSVKGTLEVTEIINESLIGGFIVKIDDKQVDASIASQFNKLKQRLTR